ncbi:hypothetical protein XENTR_v10023510 [Xenopus tropicalis]|nr:hypothetical protein XENTR_v10023510 [Xenopus tropicalis]
MVPAQIGIFLLFVALLPLKLGGAIECLLVPTEANFTLCGMETKLYMYPTFNDYIHGLLTIKCDQNFKQTNKTMDYAGIVCSEDENWENLYDLFPYQYSMYCYEKSRCHYFRKTDEGKPIECPLTCSIWERIYLA